MKTIYIDMDGVLVDFNGGAEKVFGITSKDYDISNPNMEEALGMTSEEFWNKINGKANFWESLELYPWSKKLWDICSNICDTYILSAPTMKDINCIPGKIKWLRKFFGKNPDKVVFTKHKHLLSRDGSILIDDRESYREKFNAMGGKFYIFPQPWNSERNLLVDAFLNSLNQSSL